MPHCDTTAIVLNSLATPPAAWISQAALDLLDGHGPEQIE